MPATYQKDTVLGRINSLLNEINGTTKSASEMGMTGEGKKDPGGYCGKSTHPSAMEASNVQSAPWGSHAKELEKEMKEDHPTGVDATSEIHADEDSKMPNIGTHQSATGEDPKVEDDYRDGKKDDKRQGERGGTSGPFDAEKIKSSSFEEITKVAYDKLNGILAELANGKAPVTQSNTKQAAPVQPVTEFDKVAAAQAIIEQVILDARLNADLVGEFLTKYAHNSDQLAKQADEGGPMGGAMSGQGPEGAEGGMPPEAAGGMPPEAGPPGAGGPPGAEGGSDGGIEELVNGLISMGIPPDKVIQVLEEHMGGGGGGGAAGGMPPEAAGGMPPEAGPPGAGGEMGKMGSYNRLNEDQQILLKAAYAADKKFRSGNWQMRPVKQGSKEAAERAELQRYIVEVCNFR